MSIYSIELNSNLEIMHMSATYYEGAPEPQNGLIIDNRYSDLFEHIMTKIDLIRKAYSFDLNKLSKKSDSKLNEIIIEYVDRTPVMPKTGYIVDSKDTTTLSPEELNAIAEPIPTLADFPDIPSDFVKENLYNKSQQKT